MQMHLRRAFTIVELIIVIAIIAVLALVASPYLSDYLGDTRLVVIKTNEKLVQDAIAKFFETNMKYPSSLEELQGPYLFKSITELFQIPGAGDATVQVEVAKDSSVVNLFHVPESDREWIDYQFAAHDGRQISSIRVFLGSAPTSTNPTPLPSKYQLTLSGTHISSSPASGMIDAGTLVTITVSPPTYYVVSAFSVAGVDRLSELVALNYSFNISQTTSVVVAYSVDSAIEVWDPSKTYGSAGLIVQYNGSVYKTPWYLSAGIVPTSAPWIEITDEWRTNNIYYLDDEIWHNGVLFKARQWTQGDEPGITGNPWNEVTDQWRVFNQYDAGTQIWYNGLLYEANWYINPGDTPPDANAAWSLV